MTEQKYVLEYQNELTEELEKYEELKAKAERKIALISQKLKNPARAFGKELKEGSLRAKKIMGVAAPARKSNLPGRRSEAEQVEEVINDLRKAGFKTSSRYHNDDEEKSEKKKGFFSSLFEEDEE